MFDVVRVIPRGQMELAFEVAGCIFALFVLNAIAIICTFGLAPIGDMPIQVMPILFMFLMGGLALCNWLVLTRLVPAYLERTLAPLRPVGGERWRIRVVVLPAIAGMLFSTTPVAGALSLGATLFAFVYHAVPGHRRALKYLVLFVGEMVLTPGPFVLVFMLAGIAAAKLVRCDGEPPRMTLRTRALFRFAMQASNERGRVLYLLLLALLLVIHYRLILSATSYAALEIGLERAYIADAIRSRIRELFALILLVRYFGKDAALSTPVLFLRPFSSRALRGRLKVVLSPLTEMFVLRCLVHKTQRASRLQRGLPASQFLSAHYESDNTWQEWVETELASCAGVIFDFSEGSPADRSGLHWEYERAMNLLPRNRIAVLVNGTSSPPDVAHARTIPILPGQEWAARSALIAWASAL